MTAEQRTYIAPSDIAAIELSCECGSRVRYQLLTMQPQVFRSRQHFCPNCKEPLASGPEANRIAELAEALQVLIKGDGEARLQLELQGETPVFTTPR